MSDQRWTGGLANREWQRGTRREPGLIDAAYLAGQVRLYLADCYAARETLNPAYHPTEAGALKVICHQGPEQAGQVRAAYRDKR